MEKKEGTEGNPNKISTEDIHKALEPFGNRSKSPEQDRLVKASNRDSGVSESCSSYFSDPLSATSDGQSIFSDSERLSFTSDTFSIVSDPLGVYGSSDEGDNEVHSFSTDPWDEKQSLETEWNVLFSSQNFLHELSQHALNGKLKLSKYRSIAWRLFLDCLPEDKSEWITKTKQLRHEYDIFKQKSLIDPNESKEDDDSLHIFHPLSLEDQSPWNQYFKDNELKAIINQDIDRLYPEMDFFHSPNIKEMMLTLLFCYAKKNESLGYKQGMHELLAPIIFVLDHDSQTHKYMEGDGLEISRCLLDPAYIEHDAFCMFSQLMEVTEAWYQQHQPVEISTNNKFIGQQAEPFTDPLASPPTAIVKKLNKIQDHLLRKYDPDLWIHMKELNIAPQVYGLRWIRLLFSREFPFQDVLVIWDALFAEGSHLDLVDYIYIVLLQTIKNKLMAGNYVTCMGHLMKFPRVYSVHVYVKKAVNLRNAKKSRPPSRVSARLSSPPASTAKGSQRRSTERENSTTGGKIQKKTSHRRPPSTFSTLTKRYTPFMDQAKHRTIANRGGQADSQPNTTELVHKSPRTPWTDILPPATRDRTDSTNSIGSNSGRSMKSLGSDLKTKFSRPRSRSRQSVEELEKDHQRLQIQVSQLNSDKEKMQGLYLYCGRKLDSYIGLIQEEISKDDEADRDVIYLSLAGLKQVRDLLKGTLTYGDTTETEKDFVDIDKGIANRLQITSPNIRPAASSDNTLVPSLANFNLYDDTNGKETSFSAISTSINNGRKSEDSNANVGLNDSQSKCVQNIKGSEDVDYDESQGGVEMVWKPEKECLRVACSADTSAKKKILEDSNIQGLLETKDDHFNVEEHDEIQSGVAESRKENVPQNSKVLSLDSYLKEHFGDDTQCKEPTKIAAVPCATGPDVNTGGTPSSDEPLLVTKNHDKQHIPMHHKVNKRSKGDSNGLKLRDQKNILVVENSSTDSVLSDSSTPDEPLDGFVFVNQDGTARSDHGSPARLSPAHRLETNEDSDRFI